MLLLDVGMKRIEVDLDVGRTHFSHELRAIGKCIEEVSFKAVQRFDANRDASLLGDASRRSATL